MGPSEPRIDRLLALVAAGLLALNYPLLRIFESPILVLGIPVLYLYLFIVWITVIALVAVTMEWRAGGGEARDPDA